MKAYTPQLIIFDCDGVLVDSEIISAKMLRQEAELFGVDLSMDYILTNYVGRSYPKVLADIQKQFDILLPEDFEASYRARLLSAFEQDLKIVAGVVDVLQGLSVPYCVATSSSPKRVERSLELVGLTQFFTGKIFTASQVKNGKPAPDLFLLASKTMGVPAENCLVIEDSLSGVEAGKAANMQVLRFTGGSHIKEKSAKAGADFVFDNFAQFFEHFPELRITIGQEL